MRVIYRITQFFLVAFFKVFFRLNIAGKHHVPRKGAVIVASTHASNLDPMLIGAPLPRKSHYMARRSLFQPRWWGAVLRGYGAIPLDREGEGSAKSAMRAVLGLLEEDKCVVIFPEGTRSRDGELQPLRGGVGLMARRTGAPVVPVALAGNERALKKGSPLPRPVRIAIRYGEPMQMKSGESEAEFLARLRSQFEGLRSEALDAIGTSQKRSAVA